MDSILRLRLMAPRIRSWLELFCYRPGNSLTALCIMSAEDEVLRIEALIASGQSLGKRESIWSLERIT